MNPVYDNTLWFKCWKTGALLVSVKVDFIVIIAVIKPG
jgi:hypothetical protein